MKKQYFFIGLVLVAVAAITTLAIYKYNGERGLTVGEATSQRDTALVNLKIQKALNENDRQAVTNLTASNKKLTEDQATLCAQIKAAKLVQPLCN